MYSIKCSNYRVFVISMKYIIDLSEKEFERLEKMVKTGNAGARTITRAWILLKSCEGLPYDEIMAHLNVSKGLILKVKRRYHEEGLDACLYEKPRSGQPKKVTADIEAKITALACETPPEGRAFWTIELLHAELKQRFSVSIGMTSVQKVLKAHGLKPWKKKCGAFPGSTSFTLSE